MFKQYIYSILLASILGLSLYTDNYFSLVYIEAALLVFMVIEKLGRGIVLRELIAFHMTLVCLVIPIFGYTVYNRFNTLAQIWVRFMPIEAEKYFGFSLPAVTAFALAITFPFKKRNDYDQGEKLSLMLNTIKESLNKSNKIGIYLILFGMVMLYFSNIVSVSLQFILNLFWFSSFTGFLYVFFSGPFKMRKPVLIGYTLFIVAYTLSLGMFTIVAYMGMLLFSFIFLGSKISIIRKALYFVVAVMLLIIIQSVKPAYRTLTWKENFEGNKFELFYDLVVDKVSEGDIVNEEALFPLYYRANQGFNVALVMIRMPRIRPHDGGENLAINILSSFVPRFLWPDKPEAGGKHNMKYYAGSTIVGYSTNIGPLGEAYGSFGINGGIAYMFFLGLFIRYAYSLVFILSKKLPVILLWMPVLFFQVTYSAEADTLQIMNSLIKASFFIFLLYGAFPRIFMKKQVFDTRKMAIRRLAINSEMA